ncbi:MAG: hypothetical protein ABIJ34_05055 [archaeon]
MSKWTLTKFIVSSALGVLTVVLTLPASALVAFTGIPLMGGFINLFIDRVLDTITALSVNKFGSVTLKRTVLGIVAIPTLLLGPPGFIVKVIISASNGLIIDFVYLFVKEKKIAAVLSNGIGAVALGFTFVFLGRIFRMPGVDETARVFLSPLMILLTFIGGAISGYLGWFIFQKIKNTSVIKRIQR